MHTYSLERRIANLQRDLWRPLTIEHRERLNRRIALLQTQLNRQQENAQQLLGIAGGF